MWIARWKVHTLAALAALNVVYAVVLVAFK